MNEARDQQRLLQRYTHLVWLVRHHWALHERGTYADGTAPDSVAFAKTWVRAKVRRAVDWGALADEQADPGVRDRAPAHCAAGPHTTWNPADEP